MNWVAEDAIDDDVLSMEAFESSNLSLSNKSQCSKKLRSQCRIVKWQRHLWEIVLHGLKIILGDHSKFCLNEQSTIRALKYQSLAVKTSSASYHLLPEKFILQLISLHYDSVTQSFHHGLFISLQCHPLLVLLMEEDDDYYHCNHEH